MELRDYARGLRRHWLGIVAMTVLGFALAFGWAQLQTPVYEATASGLVRSSADANGGVLPVYDALAMQKVPTYLKMAGWEEVAQGAIDKLGLSASPQQVAGLVTVTNPESTALIQVTARGSSATAAAAAALAEAWIASLTDVINTVEGGENGVSPMTIYLASSAAVPTSPVYPDLRTAIIVGIVLGLGFGVAFALIRTAGDRRVRAADDIEGRIGSPVVGTIPVVGRGASESRLLTVAGDADADRAVSEAMRSLRTNLQFMDVDHPPRTIVITSSVTGDGKSMIACNLAVTLAASGRPVVLVDGDLRRPVVASTMGLLEGVGLTDVLAGRAELLDAVQRVPGSPNLLVLGAGITPPNPSEILGSERMRSVIDELSQHATVIIDAPPLLPVTDGAVLTSQADGALLVVSIGKTTYDIVDKAVDTLAKAHGRLLGVVLNRMPMRGVDASPYARVYEQAYAAAGHSPSPIPVTVPAQAPGPRRSAEPAADAATEPVLAPVPDRPVSVPRAASAARGKRATSAAPSRRTPSALADADLVEGDDDVLGAVFEGLDIEYTDGADGPRRARRPR